MPGRWNAIRQFVARCKHKGLGFEFDAVGSHHLHFVLQRRHLGKLGGREEPAPIGDGALEQADCQRRRVDVGGAIRQQGRIAIQSCVRPQFRVREKLRRQADGSPLMAFRRKCSRIQLIACEIQGTARPEGACNLQALDEVPQIGNGPEGPQPSTGGAVDAKSRRPAE